MLSRTISARCRQLSRILIRFSYMPSNLRQDFSSEKDADCWLSRSSASSWNVPAEGLTSAAHTKDRGVGSDLVEAGRACSGLQALSHAPVQAVCQDGLVQLGLHGRVAHVLEHLLGGMQPVRLPSVHRSLAAPACPCMRIQHDSRSGVAPEAQLEAFRAHRLSTMLRNDNC